jgi:hypothetical protein
MIMTYIPGLNTWWGLGSLFKRQVDCAKARIIYSKALVGYGKPSDLIILAVKDYGKFFRL